MKRLLNRVSLGADCSSRCNAVRAKGVQGGFQAGFGAGFGAGAHSCFITITVCEVCIAGMVHWHGALPVHHCMVHCWHGGGWVLEWPCVLTAAEGIVLDQCLHWQHHQAQYPTTLLHVRSTMLCTQPAWCKGWHNQHAIKCCIRSCAGAPRATIQ